MLSEISNELQNGQEMTYVTEVLERVGLTPNVGYSGGQDSFRAAIMKEYQFELIGEGHDWFNNRRRGYNYFRDNIIIPLGVHYCLAFFTSSKEMLGFFNVMLLKIESRIQNLLKKYNLLVMSNDLVG